MKEVSQVSKPTDTCDTKKNLGRKPRKPQNKLVTTLDTK